MIGANAGTKSQRLSNREDMKLVIVERIDHVETYLTGQVVVSHAKERVDFSPPETGVKLPRFSPYAGSVKT